MQPVSYKMYERVTDESSRACSKSAESSKRRIITERGYARAAAQPPAAQRAIRSRRGRELEEMEVLERRRAWRYGLRTVLTCWRPAVHCRGRSRNRYGVAKPMPCMQVDRPTVDDRPTPYLPHLLTRFTHSSLSLLYCHWRSPFFPFVRSWNSQGSFFFYYYHHLPNVGTPALTAVPSLRSAGHDTSCLQLFCHLAEPRRSRAAQGRRRLALYGRTRRGTTGRTGAPLATSKNWHKKRDVDKLLT